MATNAATANTKLEVVTIGVSDVDRAKAFYEKLGWRLDADFTIGDAGRGVQMTPPGSECSIHFGKGITSTKPGELDRMILAVDDIDIARADLVARGVDVSDVYHNDEKFSRVPGRDPNGRSYASFASFKDPDGNGWLLQEITTRLPGREWKPVQAETQDVLEVANLLRETGEHHDAFEKSHEKHQWWDWYAAYLIARQKGSNPDDASTAANGYMEDVLHVLPL